MVQCAVSKSFHDVHFLQSIIFILLLRLFSSITKLKVQSVILEHVSRPVIIIVFQRYFIKTCDLQDSHVTDLATFFVLGFLELCCSTLQFFFLPYYRQMIIGF